MYAWLKHATDNLQTTGKCNVKEWDQNKTNLNPVLSCNQTKSSGS
jgi:NADH:ubiquinone oxidoreductase subunit